MKERDPRFENLRKFTLNFMLSELKILSDVNQEFNIINVFFAPTSPKIYSVFIKRSILLVVCMKTKLLRKSQDCSTGMSKVINYLILR